MNSDESEIEGTGNDENYDEVSARKCRRGNVRKLIKQNII